MKHALHHFKYFLLYGILAGTLWDLARYPVEHRLWESEPLVHIAEWAGVEVDHEKEESHREPIDQSDPGGGAPNLPPQPS